jgi:hypothetical protein
MNTVDILSHASTSKRMRAHVFNRILVQHGAKLKWETRRMGWCWFPLVNVYGMAPVFFPLVLNQLSVEWKLFSKVCDPLLVGHRHSMKTDEPCWLNLALNGPSTNKMNSKYWIVWAPQDPKQGWIVLIVCPMHQHQRGWGHIYIQQNISLAWCKTQVGG